MATLTYMPQNFQQPIRSAIAEAMGLGWGDLAPVLIHFPVSLDAANALRGDSEYIRVDRGRALLVWSMYGHLAMNRLSQETLSANSDSLLAVTGVDNREWVKAMNARVTLRHVDTDRMEVMQSDVQNSAGERGLTFPLSSLFLGGGVHWCRGNDIAPLIVGENNRLSCSVSLSEVASAGEDTEYGVVLVGALIRASAT